MRWHPRTGVPKSSGAHMRPLEGRRVALLETRKADDLVRLVERLGGTALPVESVQEVRRTADVQPVVERLVGGGFDAIVILTAAAADALFVAAAGYGVLQETIVALQRMTIACRGPKPLLALRRRGLSAHIVTDKPHTADELVGALDAVDLRRRRTLLLHYGERNANCAAALQDRGADLTELSLYDWALPDDLGGLERLVHDTIAREVDVVLFTSQVQFRHVLEVARASGQDVTLVEALRNHVIIGSVGPVCTRAIRAAGIVPDVMPALANAASLVHAVADYLTMFDPSKETAS
jgi:uroporphyrinogen-III synthase